MSMSSGICDMRCTECELSLCARDILEYEQEAWDPSWSELDPEEMQALKELSTIWWEEE